MIRDTVNTVIHVLVHVYICVGAYICTRRVYVIRDTCSDSDSDSDTCCVIGDGNL